MLKVAPAATAPNADVTEVKARRNVPNVDGAFTPGSTLCTAPSGQHPQIGDVCAPVSIPATIEQTFAAASLPAPPGIVTFAVNPGAQPALRASRITGTSPAELIKLVSSKVATAFGIWDS